MDLSDLDSAYQEAIRGIRSIMADEVSNGHLSLTGRIEVKDETGSVAMYVGFREALIIDS